MGAYQINACRWIVACCLLSLDNERDRCSCITGNSKDNEGTERSEYIHSSHQACTYVARRDAYCCTKWCRLLNWMSSELLRQCWCGEVCPLFIANNNIPGRIQHSQSYAVYNIDQGQLDRISSRVFDHQSFLLLAMICLVSDVKYVARELMCQAGTRLMFRLMYRQWMWRLPLGFR